MEQSFEKLMHGYQQFRKKYVTGDDSTMKMLSYQGQKPEVMIVACCDSRVDPALILQCDPGDLFIVRNVANIVPPYECDHGYHGTSAALEFGICYLNVKHLILLGHSQCGGIEALLKPESLGQNDFLTQWVSLIQVNKKTDDVDVMAKKALSQSYQNCMTFPWIQKKVNTEAFNIHRWFFDIKKGEINYFDIKTGTYLLMNVDTLGL